MSKHDIVTGFSRYERISEGPRTARRDAWAWVILLAFGLMLAPEAFAQSSSGLGSISNSSSQFGSSSDSNSNSSSMFNSNSSSLGSSSSRRSSTSSSRRSSTSRSRRSSTSSDSSSSRRSSRRTSTSKDKSTSEKTSEAKANPGEPAAAKVGAKTVVATRKAKGGRPKGGGPSASGLPEIKINPELHMDAVYFTPQLIHVAPGDRFATAVEYYNSATASVDSADLWIKYDSTLLEPVWVDTAALREHGGEDIVVQGWPEDGYLNVSARLGAPMSATINPMVQIHWRALAPVLRTTIDFEGPEGKDISLLDDGKNVIQTTGIGNRGRVSAVVCIAEQELYPEGLQLVDKVRETLRPDAGAEDAAGMKRDEPIRLAILAAEPMVSTDQISMADIVVVNPSQLAFDDIRFRIRFDPDAVEIMDADEDNYINTGLNVFDGDFHEMFPFDYHGSNEVDPERGIIEYHAGLMQGARRFPSGAVARIVYRMKRKAGKAVFWFERTDPGSGRVTTDITNMGRSLFDESTMLAGQLLIDATVGVRPMDLRTGLDTMAGG